MPLSIQITGASFTKNIGPVYPSPLFADLNGAVSSAVNGRYTYTFAAPTFNNRASISDLQMLGDGNLYAKFSGSFAAFPGIALSPRRAETKFDVLGNYGFYIDNAKALKLTQGTTGNITPNVTPTTYIAGMSLRLRRAGSDLFADVSTDDWKTFTTIHNFSVTSSVTLFPLVQPFITGGGSTSTEGVTLVGGSKI